MELVLIIIAAILGFTTAILLYQKAKYQGKFEQLDKESVNLRREKEGFVQEIRLLQEKLLQFEKQNELLKQAEIELEKQKSQWSKEKEGFLFKLSEELLRKNQEQQNQISSSQQENMKKITENLFKNFEEITAKVASLGDDVKKSNEAVDLTKNALLNPASSGRLAEITLENILKNSGLREKEEINSVGDYILQSHFGVENAEGRRPDAILFLPNNQIVVIDSKSSSHFLEFYNAQKQGLEEEKVILDKIKESMRRHVETLKKRDYSKFLLENLLGKKISDYKITLIMFLQTEQILETVNKADKLFEQKAMDSGIIVATPIGLIHLLSQAKFIIDRIKQQENIENLKIEIRKLLDNVAVVFKESQELGKSLNKSLQNYNKLAQKLNKNILNNTKKIEEFGIIGKRSENLKELEEYHEE